MTFTNNRETGGKIRIKDEGLTLTSGATSIDFTGAGVTGTVLGTEVTETIPGGGGGGASGVYNEVPTGTVNGINDEFTIAYSPLAGTVNVYVNGTRMKVTDDYTIAGTTITFVTPPPTGSNLLVDYILATTVADVHNEVPTGDINGVNTDFVIANTPTSGSVMVYLNGARQKITSDYTFSGTTITFLTAPPSGSNILVDYSYAT